MTRPVPYICALCRKPTSAVLGTILAMLALCQPCFDARLAKGRAVQEAGK